MSRVPYGHEVIQLVERLAPKQLTMEGDRIGLQIGTLMAGSVVIETIFRWPGIGKLVMDSITSRDYPVIMGFVLVMGTIYVVINQLTDLCYHLLDPRVRT